MEGEKWGGGGEFAKEINGKISCKLGDERAWKACWHRDSSKYLRISASSEGRLEFAILDEMTVSSHERSHAVLDIVFRITRGLNDGKTGENRFSCARYFGSS